MKLTPINEYKWTDDYSYHRIMTCTFHPTTRYFTKNPYCRSIFVITGTNGERWECNCPMSDLMVITEDGSSEEA